jgi:hypothetical protein
LRLGFSLGLLCAVLGCGAGPPPRSGNEARIDAAPNVAESKSLRRPSSAIAKRWPFQRPPSFSLYADLLGFTKTEVFRTFATAAMTMGRAHIGDDQASCISALLANAKELAFGYEEDGDAGIFVLHHAPELRARAGDCLRRFGGKPGPAIAGAREVFDFGNLLVAVDDGDIVVVGSKSLVEVAFARSSNAGPALALDADEYIAWSADARDVKSTGSLLCSRERFRLLAQFDVKDEQLATRLALMADRSKETLSTQGGSEEREIVRRLLEALKIERDGNRFDVRFELVKSPEEQAKDIGMGAALAIYGVRRYLSRAKQSEARYALGAIAKGYVSWWEREEVSSTLTKPKKTKKLFSLIAVPTKVPEGKKYQSAEGEWKSWQTIGFSMSDPQYFQYEVKAAKDGQSADIIAHGDLNGDGKTSTFTLRMKVDSKMNTLAITPQIEEVDPDE